MGKWRLEWRVSEQGWGDGHIFSLRGCNLLSIQMRSSSDFFRVPQLLQLFLWINSWYISGYLQVSML